MAIPLRLGGGTFSDDINDGICECECNKNVASRSLPMKGDGVSPPKTKNSINHTRSDSEVDSSKSLGSLLPVLPNNTSSEVPLDPNNPNNNGNPPVLFFAGEATIRNHFATVHGAYISGRREARRILKVLGSNGNGRNGKDSNIE